MLLLSAKVVRRGTLALVRKALKACVYLAVFSVSEYVNALGVRFVLRRVFRERNKEVKMTLAKKSLLFSLLVFPGGGYFVVHRKILGVLAAAASLVALYFLAIPIFGAAQTVSNQILMGEVAPDVFSIRAAIEVARAQQPSAGLLPWLVLLLTWVGSAAHGYVLGKKMDKAMAKGDAVSGQ